MTNQNIDQGEVVNSPYSLTIEALRRGNYPGSDIAIEQTLSAGSNYQRYIASYKSEGLKIYALLTVPNGSPPDGGWPAIVFNHGYIRPTDYRTDEKYVAYVDGFARNGYVVIKPDFRGHGDSEGEASGAYGSVGYTIDVLNAVSSIKKLRDPSTSSGRFVVDTNRIGMWGHSMGGYITLRSMVVSQDVKAGVIWAGVVASYGDLLNNWRRPSFSPAPLPSGARRWRQQLTELFGTPQQNPDFWNSISANAYLSDISGPLQLHHGTADVSVPVNFSTKLAEQMQATGKVAELFTYEGDDHNLSANFNLAMERSVEFFDRYLK
ncbi:peptidase [Candidatus Curtissbacteria bacterium RIFCSPLOWO2_02_FULL_40_13b]|uniref:Peptidase n=3 Tax=Candidatus Curtissiibacteriota TaxID=1752717 RepID=A0A1F5HPF0_9BACT|nr:MAG: peptidase [Candidatus Curtissbacteria bacterium RIFCSPHIGHO2_01_FULL_40_12]OGE04892.1 MAG: peptidase [Candidatus Curtissbacteria bacterium RIFCSPHIGHO2_12_FULL_41_17]OGE05899.1 MAG: peptidase [Candidatus Curtissbacteria bacterium RIFCSPLOWO2_02_FULL_40_13b]